LTSGPGPLPARCYEAFLTCFLFCLIPQEQRDLETLHFFCWFCVSWAKSFSLPDKNQAMAGSNTSCFLWSKVLSKTSALVPKGLVARKGKAQRARGSGRAAGPTPLRELWKRFCAMPFWLPQHWGGQQPPNHLGKPLWFVSKSSHEPSHPKPRFLGVAATSEHAAPSSQLGRNRANAAASDL